MYLGRIVERLARHPCWVGPAATPTQMHCFSRPVPSARPERQHKRRRGPAPQGRSLHQGICSWSAVSVFSWPAAANRMPLPAAKSLVAPFRWRRTIMPPGFTTALKAVRLAGSNISAGHFSPTSCLENGRFRFLGEVLTTNSAPEDGVPDGNECGPAKLGCHGARPGSRP